MIFDWRKLKLIIIFVCIRTVNLWDSNMYKWETYLQTKLYYIYIYICECSKNSFKFYVYKNDVPQLGAL